MGFYQEPQTDWLTVSYSPTTAAVDDVRGFLLDYGAANVYGDQWKISEHSTIHLKRTSTFHAASFSGSALEQFRHAGVYMNLLRLLSEYPHRITRLDVALDRSIPGHEVVPAFYRAHKLYGVRLGGRKSLQVSAVLSSDADGRETGTVYAGTKTSKAVVRGKIYDKGHEQQSKYQRRQHPEPWTRYELTYRDAYATLKDAAEPGPIFWHHASPGFLDPEPRLDVVQPWTQGESPQWEYVASERTPAQRLASMVERSDLLGELAEYSDQLGPYGRSYLLQLISQRIGADEAKPAA